MTERDIGRIDTHRRKAVFARLLAERLDLPSRRPGLELCVIDQRRHLDRANALRRSGDLGRECEHRSNLGFGLFFQSTLSCVITVFPPCIYPNYNPSR